MWQLGLLTIGLLYLAAVMGCSDGEDGSVTGAADGRAEVPVPAGWKLVFHDEFDGEALDLAKWNPRDPEQRERNHELQAYVPDAFRVGGGVLRIVAERRQATYDGKPRDFTSGMMTTTGRFAQAFGRFEVRCRIPAGKGLWPAAWLLPEPFSWPPEIDILETLGHEPTVAHFTHHWRDAGGTHVSDGGRWSGPDLSADFHVYAVDWSPGRIVWSLDGQERFRSEQSVPQVPMFLLLNLAVGGDWPGAPDDRTPFPSSFDVDYVRVYRRQQL